MKMREARIERKDVSRDKSTRRASDGGGSEELSCLGLQTYTFIHGCPRARKLTSTASV